MVRFYAAESGWLVLENSVDSDGRPLHSPVHERMLLRFCEYHERVKSDSVGQFDILVGRRNDLIQCECLAFLHAGCGGGLYLSPLAFHWRGIRFGLARLARTGEMVSIGRGSGG